MERVRVRAFPPRWTRTGPDSGAYAMDGDWGLGLGLRLRLRLRLRFGRSSLGHVHGMNDNFARFLQLEELVLEVVCVALRRDALIAHVIIWEATRSASWKAKDGAK